MRCREIVKNSQRRCSKFKRPARRAVQKNNVLSMAVAIHVGRTKFM